MALRKGKPFLVFGSPGADVQIQAMLQVFLNVSVFGMDVQAAIEAPRFATYSFPASFAPHDYFPGRSEEHTSELQSLMRISYAVCCLKKNSIKSTIIQNKQ